MNDLEKILLKEDILTSIKENEKTLFELIPELKRMIGFSHKYPHHHLDVWGHTLLALCSFMILEKLLVIRREKSDIFMDIHMNHFTLQYQF